MMDSFQDTNIEAYNHPSAAVDVIEVVADAFAFVVAYDLTNVVAFDPMALELVDLSLLATKREATTFDLIMIAQDI